MPLTLFTKKYSATGYLIGAIFALVLSALYSIKAWPLFIQCFVPFPELDDAVVIEGKLHIEGKAHRTKLGNVAPNFFIIDKHGTRHKVFWGLPGDEHDEYDARFEGATGKVWYHPIYGVINSEFKAVLPYLGYTHFGTKYGDLKYFYENHFNYEKYRWRFLPSFIGLLFVIYYFVKYVNTKSSEINKDHDHS